MSIYACQKCKTQTSGKGNSWMKHIVSLGHREIYYHYHCEVVISFLITQLYPNHMIPLVTYNQPKWKIWSITLIYATGKPCHLPIDAYDQLCTQLTKVKNLLWTYFLEAIPFLCLSTFLLDMLFPLNFTFTICLFFLHIRIKTLHYI